MPDYFIGYGLLAIFLILIIIAYFIHEQSKNINSTPSSLQNPMPTYPVPQSTPAEYEGEHKNCPFCGEEIKSVAIKCKHCGSFINKKGESAKVASGDTLGTVSIVAGIAGFLIGFFLFHIGILLGIVAVVCGYLGYTKGQQYSFPGMIIGAFAIFFSFIVTYMSMARFF